MLNFIDYADAENKEGFLPLDDDTEFWYHIRYETDEETWEDYVENLNNVGYNVSYVKRGVGNNHGQIGTGEFVFQGLLFESGKEKLMFIMKCSV